jgi:hypothetical protein
MKRGPVLGDQLESRAPQGLSQCRPCGDDIDELLDGLRSQGPRGIAVITARYLENALDEALRVISKLQTKRKTFSEKIALAYEHHIIGPKTKHDLEIVREIRNAMAHSDRAISFDTPPVATLCRSLNALTGYPLLSPQDERLENDDFISDIDAIGGQSQHFGNARSCERKRETERRDCLSLVRGCVYKRKPFSRYQVLSIAALVKECRCHGFDSSVEHRKNRGQAIDAGKRE